MNLKKILKRALPIFVVLYVMFVVWAVFEYRAYVSAVIAKYEAMGIPPEWVDPHPFYYFWYAKALIIFGFLLLSLGIFLAFLTNKKATFCLVISAFLILPMLGLSRNNTFSQASDTVLTVERVDVNTLLFFDEECTDQDRRSWIYQSIFTDTITDPLSPDAIWYRFMHEFSINFTCLNGYNTFWDSTDGQTNIITLLQEAIRENGGVWDDSQKWWVWKPHQVNVNGVNFWVDFLLFFSNQELDIQGLSPDIWNAALISFTASFTVMQHELSHQYRPGHCSNYCVMNPNWAWLVFNWCDECKNIIMSHREKWGYKQMLTLDATLASTIPYPGTYQYLRGASVTLTALNPGGSWIFYYWKRDGEIIYDNPYTFTITTDTNVYAYFGLVHSPSGGVGGFRPALCK
jgi:hypothetical protein